MYIRHRWRTRVTSEHHKNQEVSLQAMPTHSSFAVVWASALVAGCAALPSEQVSEKLDPDTATTVTVLSRPIELISATGRGPTNDPFAYLAPFETDRQGTRALFLWVSAPQGDRASEPPEVLCNGQPVSLQPLKDGDLRPSAGSLAQSDLTALNLSHAPYDAPVPWSVQWYFRLPPDGLKCLAGADGIALEMRAASGGDTSRFTAERKALASLDAFTRR
jgi:hypothetical protein